jgi:hypothetical protein
MYLFLPLGSHPPASRVLAEEELHNGEFTHPLDSHVCLDCGLIQVPDCIPPDFYRHYFYVPSASETMHRHFDTLASTLIGRFVRGPGDMIVDIGSNDGLFLAACNAKGARTLGIEPAANLSEVARQKGVEVVNEYFGPETARQVREAHGPARVIVTTNTFNHIDDLHAFMRGVTTLLDDDGVFVIEVPHALDLIEKNEFDTIYHEHLSEFSVKSLVDLFAFFGMEVFDIERLEVHGGSMRVFGQRAGASRPVMAVVAEWLRNEVDGGLFERATYDAFRDRVEANRRETTQLIARLKAEGHSIAGYGAPSKGNTLLNYYGLGPADLDFLVDRSSLKQGRYSPGAHIPIVAPERILEEQPDYLFVLAWNFADEIMQQQAEYRRRGGKFILPIPEPVVIS